MSQFAQEVAFELSKDKKANSFLTMDWVAKQWGTSFGGTQRVQLYDAAALHRSNQITSKELVQKCLEILK